jgi:hypothetical protein
LGDTLPHPAPLTVKFTGSPLTGPPLLLFTVAVTVEVLTPFAGMLDGLAATVTVGAAGVV